MDTLKGYGLSGDIEDRRGEGRNDFLRRKHVEVGRKAALPGARSEAARPQFMANLNAGRALEQRKQMGDTARHEMALQRGRDLNNAFAQWQREAKPLKRYTKRLKKR